MGWWEDVFKSPTRRKSEQDAKRREALTKAKTALRRERRAVARRQNQGEELRRKAVEHERQGKAPLARQAVRQFVQVDKECMARSLALGNMEYTLEQVKMKDNYDEFVRGMRVVADIEDLVQQSVDPDEVRERLTDLAARNQDLIEPWTETASMEGIGAADMTMSPEEQEAYDMVMSEAVGEIERTGREPSGVGVKMDQDLEQKMKQALGRE